jgi:hypothetical protein
MLGFMIQRLLMCLVKMRTVNSYTSYIGCIWSTIDYKSFKVFYTYFREHANKVITQRKCNINMCDTISTLSTASPSPFVCRFPVRMSLTSLYRILGQMQRNQHSIAQLLFTEIQAIQYSLFRLIYNSAKHA